MTNKELTIEITIKETNIIKHRLEHPRDQDNLRNRIIRKGIMPTVYRMATSNGNKTYHVELDPDRISLAEEVSII